MRSININELNPHPHNPRKELGDLTELAASIKENGVMQNLTVVRNSTANDIYTVVIGHRRLAAAKLAGLETLPCQIVEMNECKQISTMLLENMQRSDLTVYEQAQGFQMMLDLGESVVNIAKQTGFSDTTIRRRVKLLELDAEKFKASEARGATLMDYVALEQIEDVKARNHVLESIGTSNFNYEIKSVLDTQKRKKGYEKTIETIKEFATELNDPEELMTKDYFRIIYPGDKVEKPNDADRTKYYFKTSETQSYIRLYTDKDEKVSKKEEQEARERAEKDERRNALKEICKRAYQLRRDFVMGLSSKEISAASTEIIIKAIEAMMDSGYNSYDMDDLREDLGIQSDHIEVIRSAIGLKPERALLVLTWNLIDSEDSTCNDWHGNYMKDHAEDMREVYMFLKKLKYEISDEEQAILDGTHVLYAPKPVEQVKEEEIIKNCTNCRYQFDSEDKCGEKCGTEFKNWEQADDE
jgi:ParB family chromosome partitioning protein